jgi:hypothetical protein
MTDQNEGLGWKAALPPDLQQHEALTDIKEVKDLGSKYVELAGKSKNALFVPSADAKDEEKAAFRAKVNEVRGVPDAEDKYKLPFDEKAEGYSPEIDKGIRKMFKDAEVDSVQAEKLMKGFLEMGGSLVPAQKEKVVAQAVAQVVADQKAETEKAMAEAEATIRKDWGGDYDKKAAAVRKTVDNIEKVVPGFKTYADESGLGNNPYLLKVFSFFGEAISEDVFLKGARHEADKNQPEGTFNYPSMDK